MDTIAKIYAEVPDPHCKGLCQVACGPLAMSNAEEHNIVNKHGTLPMTDLELRCSKLDGGRCSIYTERPLICRLYGATRNLKCMHGCGPDGGFLPDRQARKLLARMERVKPPPLPTDSQPTPLPGKSDGSAPVG